MEICFSIDDDELYSSYSSISISLPSEVQLRNLLNSKGMKFKDDGKPSSIINRNPIPLGVVKVDRDYKTMSTHYKQTIETFGISNE